MKVNCKLFALYVCLGFSGVTFISCKKENQRPAPTNFNYDLLTAYKWLITPVPDTFYFAEDRAGVIYRVQEIVIDSTSLIYNADSTFNEKAFPTEIFNPETTPYTGPFLANYTPLGGFNFSGTYSINQSDSTVTTIVQISGVTLPPVVHKIRILTNDSLLLWHPNEGERRYYSVTR